LSQSLISIHCAFRLSQGRSIYERGTVRSIEMSMPRICHAHYIINMTSAHLWYCTRSLSTTTTTTTITSIPSLSTCHSASPFVGVSLRLTLTYPQRCSNHETAHHRYCDGHEDDVSHGQLPGQSGGRDARTVGADVSTLLLWSIRR
jgi:hypothetical protein